MANAEPQKVKGNLLIVEDDLSARQTLEAFLTREGYEVRCAPNGQTALMFVREDPPELILLDIRLPDMDGFEVCQLLKKEDRTNNIPVIFMSALHELKDKVRGFAAGGVDYVTKPFQAEELLARVETHLTLRRLQKQIQRAHDELEERVRERTADLAAANEQLVVSEKALEERLRSRFNWGLIADMQPPDLETRIAILRNKAEAAGFRVPDEVLNYVAHQVPSNVRELEGALNCVLAHARLMHAPLTVDMAQAALAGLLGAPSDLSPEQILAAVARHYKVSAEQLTGPSRARAVSVPRQLAMYLIRRETGASLPAIGQLLGGRDHTTILHGCNKIETQIEADEALRRDWLAIKGRLSEGKAAG